MTISPQEVYALVVGIEKYQAGAEWDLNGPVNDTIKFTEWLLNRGVKPENIYLFVSPLDQNRDLLSPIKLEINPARRENINNKINNLLNDNVSGKLLYIFWGGHGFITDLPETRRRLFYTDTNYNNSYNLDFISLLDALRKSTVNSGFAKQVYFIDACANDLQPDKIENNAYNQTGDRFYPRGTQGINHQQFVLFASAEYEVASNDNEVGSGSFSQAVLEELNKLPQDCLLPNIEELTKQVELKLKEKGKPELVYIRWNTIEVNRPISYRLKKINWREICRENLQERRNLTINPLTSNTEGIRLQVDDVYVPLGLVERKKISKRETSKSPTQTHSNDSPEKGSELYKEIEITKKFEHDEFLEEVIRQNNTPKSKGKRIAIIGEPGAGKTTLLQRIADWAHKNIENLIVIWIYLADLQGKDLKSYLFETWLNNLAHQHNKAEANQELKDNFISQFNQNQVLLLLDGLDEMSVSSGNPLTEIARQMREGGAISQARIILTCRVNLWDGSSNALEDFDTYRTLDFSYPNQVEEFIEKWFSKIQETDRERGHKLCTALKAPGKERIQDLVRNPLRLTVLCLNWQSGEGNLPDTQAGIYEQFVEYFYKWKHDLFGNAKRRQELNQHLGELAIKAIDKEATRFRLREEFVSHFLGEADAQTSLLKLTLNLGWLNQVGIDENRKPVYAFFHASFEEYFAAKAIKDWHFFLNHSRKNPSEGTYRIFEPQWKQVILLWLGRKDVDAKTKQEFIDALVQFKDGCGNWQTKKVDKGFYEYQAYFLAAAGIVEYKDYSRTDEIVQQIVNWGFGYFNKKQKWVEYIDVIRNEAGAVLPPTQQTKAIAALVQLLSKPNVDDDTLQQAAYALRQIGTGNEHAIKALVQLLSKPNADDFTLCQAAESLGQIDPGNEHAIKALVQLLSKPNVNDFTLHMQRARTAMALGQIGTGNEHAIAALVQLLYQPNVNDHTLWQAAYALELIDPGNEHAIKAFVQLLSKPNVRDDILWEAAYALGLIGTGNEHAIKALVQLLSIPAAYALGQIDPGNEHAIKALVQLLSIPNVDDYTLRQAAKALGQIDPGNEHAIKALVQLLSKPNVDNFTLWQAAESLGRIDPGNEHVIKALVQLLCKPHVDDNTLQQAAKSLGQIGTGNEHVIVALVQLLSKPNVDDYTLWQAAESLVQIDLGNEHAIAALVQLLSKPNVDDFTLRQAAESLVQIDPGNEHAIKALKHYLKIFWQFDEDIYEIIWNCAQNMSYRDFYKAWHGDNLAQSITKSVKAHSAFLTKKLWR